MSGRDEDDVIREVLTVYVCSNCGYVEGGEPQAGCCRKCGRGDASKPLKVVPVAALAGLEARLREVESDAEANGEAAMQAVKAAEAAEARLRDCGRERDYFDGGDRAADGTL